jgi:hypothetical protein
MKFKTLSVVATITAIAACSDVPTASNAGSSDAVTTTRASYTATNMLLGTSRDTSSPLCALSYDSAFAPVTNVQISQIGIDHRIETTVPRHFTGLGIAAINDAAARAQLKSELLTHARARSMLNINDDVSVNRMIQPVIVAYGHNKAAFTADEQVEIEVWLGRIIDAKRDSPTLALHNIHYRNALNQMMLGIVSNNERRVQNALRVYQRAINGLRRDGSFPNDSERGGSSLNYQADSTATLVTIAELAANQGLDIYSYGGDKTIATAVNFTVDATMDTSLIFPYARRSNERWQDKPEYPASTPYAGWIERSNAEWAFYWITRFPNSPETAKIVENVEYVSRKQRNNAINPDYDFDWRVGGSAACFTSR